MMKVAIVLLCAFGWCSNVIASPVSLYNLTAIESSNALDNALRAKIESIRDRMPCGIDELGIPPLSPFVIDNLDVNFDLPEATVRGKLANVIVRDTHRFDVIRSSISMLTMRAIIRLHFSALPVTTDFIKMWARYNKDCHIIGDGNGDALIQNVIFHGEFTLAVGISGVRLSRINTEIILSGPVKTNVNSFAGTPEHQRKCHREVETTLHLVFKNNKKHINNKMSELILPIVNEQLNGLSLNDLIGLITDGGDNNEVEPCIVDDEIYNN